MRLHGRPALSLFRERAAILRKQRSAADSVDAVRGSVTTQSIWCLFVTVSVREAF
jgi:hypothetical protein